MRVLIPRNKYRISLERAKPTRAVMLPNGLFDGRETVPARFSDRTRFVRLTSDIDVNKDGKIDRRDLRKGQIVSRTPSGMPVPKRVEVDRHFRNGKFVKSHTRKI